MDQHALVKQVDEQQEAFALAARIRANPDIGKGLEALKVEVEKLLDAIETDIVDLEARRDDLMRRLRVVADIGARLGLPRPSLLTSADDRCRSLPLASGPFRGMSHAQAIRHVLTARNEPLTIAELQRALLDAGYSRIRADYRGRLVLRQAVRTVAGSRVFRMFGERGSFRVGLASWIGRPDLAHLESSPP